MDVCVVALGKIGLPLAVQFAQSGHRVVGADVNQSVVDQVNAGQEPFPGESMLETNLRRVISSGALSATTDTETAVASSDVVVVVVPLIVDAAGVPDFTAMDAATAAIGKGLQRGTLISYETTLPVGTTRSRFAPALEAASGLRCGEDFYVCHSPERVYSGRIFADLRAYPKLVGGLDDVAARRAVDFYESALQFDVRADLPRPNGVWDLGSAEAAELAKLAETTYRDLNIAYANELAMYADRIGIDIHSVIDASNSQPFSHIHRPGVAVGGHCIPVYPRFYLAGDPRAALPAAARAINDSMPGYAVAKLAEALGPLEGRRVAILGAAYRGGVKEVAFSGVFGLAQALSEFQAIVKVHDPLFTDDELNAMGFDPYHLGTPTDGAIVQADHPEYVHLTSGDLPGVEVIVDGRRVLTGTRELQGVRIRQIGTPDRAQ